jgi:hypothetical protein
MNPNFLNLIHTKKLSAKKHLFGLFLLAVIAIPVLAQDFKWTPFKEPNLKFAVVFPADPTINPPDVKKRDDGSVESTAYLFTTGSTGVYVALAGATDYNFTVDAEAELVADRDNFVKALNTKAANSRRYEFQAGDEKLPALSFDVAGETITGKANVVVRGNRAYMVVFVHQKTEDYAAAVEKFLNSFEITK